MCMRVSTTINKVGDVELDNNSFGMYKYIYMQVSLVWACMEYKLPFIMYIVCLPTKGPDSEIKQPRPSYQINETYFGTDAAAMAGTVNLLYVCALRIVYLVIHAYI